MKNLWRILSYIRKYFTYAALNIFFNVLTILFSLFSLVMLIPFLQVLFKESDPVYVKPAFSFTADFFLDSLKYYLTILINQYGPSETLAWICGLVAVIFLLKNLFRYMALYVLSPIRSGVVRDLRNELYQKILSLPLSYYSKEKKGDLIARTTDDVKEVEISIMSFIEISVREPLTILVFLVWMLMLSPSLTGFVFLMLLITVFIIGRVGKSLKRESGETQVLAGELYAMLDETISGLRIIHAFSAEKYQAQKFDELNARHFKKSRNITTRRELSSPLTEFLAICVVCTVLWYGGNLVLSNQGFKAPTFIHFMALFSQLIAPAKNFSNAYYNIRKGLASAQRIFTVLDAPVSITEKKEALPITEFKNEIEYRHVNFAYHNYDDKKIIDDFNLKISKGKAIALVGQSGAGKTTLVDLLPRFYDVSAGSILIDSNDIRDYKLHDLRRLFGMVSQESILFNDTVFNNIAFGNIHATREEVIEAARIANAHDFISQMEKGYDTYIGDRGSKMSGGERQRLTIARAVLKNPPILIL
ncbi:MAG TPA: ABC transporter ATP-binding protein, partial [Chitinophagales bacterium]|nr:ABC transporter ATP-binding protein [Chitinophagales bacterium]